jgi:polyisoprenoid-binding protein YceI
MNKNKQTRRLTMILVGFAALALFAFTNHGGGVYKTNTGNISFFSHTNVEDISAINHKVKTAFDASSGKIQFSVLVKDFEFAKALMQEHFNENYMESTKFPKATFNGMIENVEAIDFSTNGNYTANVMGELTIKGVTKEVSTTSTFKVNNGTVNGMTKFILNPEDYNIEIPKVVSNKISREIEITVDADYTHSH